MEKIGKMRKLCNVDAPQLGNRTSYKNLADLGNSLVLELQREVNGISL